MRLPRILRGTAVVIAIAALGLSSTLSASGAEPRSGQQSLDAARASLLTALQRDLGLTAQQAERQLTGQANASALEADLAARLGDRFGGAWFDSQLGKLVVAVTAADRAAQVRASGAHPVVVQRNKATLDAVKVELDGLATRDRAALAGASAWSVDPASNQVVVTVRPGQLAQVSAVVARFGDAVRLVESAIDPATTADYLDGGDPYNGCSVGFNVWRGGVGHFVTAGHCGSAGNAAYQAGVHIGPFVHSSFPGNDFAIVRNDNPGYWYQGPWVFAYNGDPNAVYNINGYRDSPAGTAVCKSGRTTGLTCGWIRGKNETVNYGASGYVYGLTRHSACVEQGDSGGSNFSWDGAGNYAEGMTSGASLRSDGSRLRCLSYFGQESVSWYQPVAEALGFYGAQVMTV